VSLLVVGSIAFDSLETPSGSVNDVIGGSAVFSSYAASFFTKPRLVGVVGEDFPEDRRQILAHRGIDLTGLTTQKGETFRWKGRYHRDLNTRDTLEVHLNVFATFDPVLPESFRNSTHVFLANGLPTLQMRVLEQVNNPHLVLADTMDLWIETQREALLALLPRVDGLLLNDSEARLLTGEDNLVRAGRAVQKLGPKFVILKKGEHGAMLFGEDQLLVMPAYPTSDVIDPTGAGDTFAGGILGALKEDAAPTATNLRRAMAYGTVLASFVVEDFSLDRLRRTTREEIDQRLHTYRKMLEF
jgi:sugar/nucleoside kinase (ribokinase family)